VSDLDLERELVVISGGAGALGRDICARLAGCGATVVSVDLAPAGEERTGTSGDNIAHFQADVSVVEEVERVFDEFESRYGRQATTVCCHAGIVASYPILDYPLEKFDELFRVNVRGAFVFAQVAARRWKATGSRGHLIFTSSWVQDHPWPHIAPYSASKAAVSSLMRSFASELAPYGIRSNAVLPGIVSAGMARRQWDEDPEFRNRAEQTIALGELQDPSSVADLFVFLCSDMASYMTGSALLVDGGCSIGKP
jgi:NAD(P)-dependent dehydrogenase (short-subunit alcohol dehydrogenase family)